MDPILIVFYIVWTIMVVGFFVLTGVFWYFAYTRSANEPNKTNYAISAGLGVLGLIVLGVNVPFTYAWIKNLRNDINGKSTSL